MQLDFFLRAFALVFFSSQDCSKPGIMRLGESKIIKVFEFELMQ